MVPDPETGVLLRWLRVIDELPEAVLAPTVAQPARRGRPPVYASRLFYKALVVLVVRRLRSVHALVALLAEPEMAEVRACLCGAQGTCPSRRTWERRLARLSAQLPEVIAQLGQELIARLHLWEDDGRAVAIDSTPLHARGKVWHQSQRRAGIRDDTRIDPDAHWTHSGWHGWVYGYKLHVVISVCPQVGVWLPLAAELTPANVADSAQAPALLDTLQRAGSAEPAPAALASAGGYVLADSGYAYADVRTACGRDGFVLVASHRGGPRPSDEGTPVRRIFHALRALAIESWNGQFKQIFDLSAQVPTRGRRATQRLVLGAVFVYQVALLDRFLLGRSLRLGLQAAIQAA